MRVTFIFFFASDLFFCKTGMRQYTLNSWAEYRGYPKRSIIVSYHYHADSLIFFCKTHLLREKRAHQTLGDRGAQVAQDVKRLPSAQVMIPGSWDHVHIWLPAFPSPSAAPTASSL